MQLDSTGTGAGVSTLRMTVSANIVVTMVSGTARFYTDAAGTLNESTTWNLNSGAERTIYLKAPSGSSVMQFSDASKITKLGSSSNDGWISSTNAAKLTAKFTPLGLTDLRMTGTSLINGALPTGLTYLFLVGNSINWTYNGALPAGLTSLRMIGGSAIAWTYEGALPTNLTSIYLNATGINWTYTGALPVDMSLVVLLGNSIAWTYDGALPTGLTYLYLSGNSIAWTYNGALPTGLTFLWLQGNSIAWTYNSALPTGLTTLALSGASIDWTGLDIGNNGNIATLSLANYRITKMSSADMVTLLTQMKNRTGTLPATVTINDYADYASPPSGVTDAVNALKAAKSITTVNLGA